MDLENADSVTTHTGDGTINTLLGDGEGGQQGTPPAEAQAPETPQQQGQPSRPTPTVPENYETFTLPEGIDAADPEVKARIDDASGVFRELGLNQTQAQKLIDLHMKHWMGGALEMEEMLEEQMNRKVAQWSRQVKGDPEFGGIHLNESLTSVRRAISELGGQPLYKALTKETGIINHPAVFAAFARMGRRLAEDRFVSGTTAQAADNSPSAVAARMYPDMRRG